MAEGARLESVYTFTGIGGSNPSLSASILSWGWHQPKFVGSESIRRAALSPVKAGTVQ